MQRNRALDLFRKMTPALGALTAAAVVATTPIPAFAQDNTEARLRKAEAEIRALQRTVFPGGDGRFFGKVVATLYSGFPDGQELYLAIGETEKKTQIIKFGMSECLQPGEHELDMVLFKELGIKPPDEE